MDNELRKQINKTLNLAYQQDWKDESFSLMKAYICAELSALVYQDVQEYELKKASRIHLFASDTYRHIIKAGQTSSLFDSLIEGEFEARFFVLRGRYAIILGAFLHKNVLILSVRGTVFQRLWDWKANLNARKYHIHDRFLGFEDQFFHRGFFEAVVPHFESIDDRIESLSKPNETTIVWTGHSLGGAMAAIGQGVYESHITRYWRRKRIHGKTVRGYTFGMPRYGGLGAICTFSGPHHIYREEDIIPTIPLRAMGFVDCAQEYKLTSSGIATISERTDTFGLLAHRPCIGIKSHSIEEYASLLKNGCQQKGDHLPESVAKMK